MTFGIWQIVLIVLVVVLVFGAGKIPRVMGDFAKGIKSFKAGMRDGEAGQPSTPSSDEKSTETEAAQTKAIKADDASAEDTANVKKDETYKT